MAETVGQKRRSDVEVEDLDWSEGRFLGDNGEVHDEGLTGLEGTGLEDTGLEDTGLEGTGLEDTGLEDTGLEGTGLEETERAGGESHVDSFAPTGLEGTGLDDTGLEDTGLDDLADTGFAGTGLEGTGLEGTGLEDEDADDDDDLFGENMEHEELPQPQAQSPSAPQATQDQLDELYDQQYVAEAEEEKPQEKKRKRGEEDPTEMFNIVKAFISKLEYTAEGDGADFERGVPAFKKLSMLKELEDMIAIRRRHETLLNGGVLGALKSWLEPLTDPKTGRMVLPHAKVRAAVYRALERLPLDTHHQEARDRLKTSGIGPVLVFYAKCSKESVANQRAANDLVQRWILPIVEEGRHDAQNQEAVAQRKQEQKRALKRRKILEKQAEKRETERLKKAQENLTVGKAGYKYHARMPKQARLDYVEMPAIPEALTKRMTEKVGREGGSRAAIKKQFLQIDRINKSAGKQRSSAVSISGKNIADD